MIYETFISPAEFMEGLKLLSTEIGAESMMLEMGR